MKLTRLFAGAMALAIATSTAAHAQSFLMTSVAADGAIVFRDYCTIGVPTSCLGSTPSVPVPYNPAKSDIRRLFGAVGAGITSLMGTQAAGSVAFLTQASINANLNYPANTLATVWADGTSANNGIYIKSGISGAGAWTQVTNSTFGLTPTWSIGSVETLDAGAPATATVSGTSDAPVLNLGIPRGAAGPFAFRGAWSSVTAYAINDVVYLSGASYVAIATSTNHTPPNATYWAQLTGALGYTALNAASNLSDLASASTARTNLGLPASATTDTTSATNISSGTLALARLPSMSNQRVLCNNSGSSAVPSACDMGKLSTAGVYNVKDPRYGALGDNLHSDVSAIMAAVTAACANGGGTIYFPPSKYLIDSTLSPTCGNIVFQGAGKGSAITGYEGATVIEVAFNTTDAISLGTSGGGYKGFAVRDMSIITELGYARAADAYIAVWSAEVEISNVNFTNCWNCISVDNNGDQAHLKMRDLLMQVCSGAGILLGHSGSSSSVEIFADAVTMGSCAAGIQSEYADGVYLSKISIFQSFNAIKFVPRTGKTVTNHECLVCYLDSSSSTGVVFSSLGSTGVVGGIKFIGGNINSNGADGLSVASGTNLYDLKLIGTKLELNQGRGLALLAGTGFDLIGVTLAYNSQAGSGVSSDIYMLNATRLKMIGGLCGPFGNQRPALGGSVNTAYCLGMDTGADYVTVSGVSSGGHATNDYVNASAAHVSLPANGSWY